jgi:hypothetical protein
MPTAPDAAQLLGVYLNDHLAGATGGSELARRLASAERDWSGGPELSRLADEVAADRVELRSIMASLDVSPTLVKVWLGWAGEKVGRLKPNRRVLGRSPLSRVIELELMRLGVEGKLSAWRALLLVSEHEPRLSVDQLNCLVQRATRQSATLEELRVRAASEAFRRITNG